MDFDSLIRFLVTLAIMTGYYYGGRAVVRYAWLTIPGIQEVRWGLKFLYRIIDFGLIIMVFCIVVARIT